MTFLRLRKMPKMPMVKGSRQARDNGRGRSIFAAPPCPDLPQLYRGRRRARHLGGDVLAPHALLVAHVSTIAPTMATSSTRPAA